MIDVLGSGAQTDGPLVGWIVTLVNLPMQLNLSFGIKKRNVVSHLTYLLLLALSLVWSFASAQNRLTADPPTESSRAVIARPDPAKIEASGLHNVYRITNKLYSGSSPDGEEGFRSLQKLGVKTVISVDGARPDAATARKYGMRYVHIPFGYDGIPTQQVLRLAKAVRDLPGAVDVHCHHGKHRGPAAAAAIHLCLDEKCGTEEALAEMKRAGTDLRYTGLYALPKSLIRPSPRDLDRVPADFPEVAKVSDLAEFMVAIDARWENLKKIKAAGWQTPSDHPDLDPAHEALQLVEQFREASRLHIVSERPEEFRTWLTAAVDEAGGLERAFGTRKAPEVERLSADKAFVEVGASCARCHAKYRDVGHKP